MPQSLDVCGWRVASQQELITFTEGKAEGGSTPGSRLIIRSTLTQVDMYTYLRARFGVPNGFQNFLRKDDSDNLIHWDFNIRAGDVDVYILGRMRNVAIMVSEDMTDEDWKALILAIKADFARIGTAKSRTLRSFEKFFVFQNKFKVLADLCSELHASIVDAPDMIKQLPRIAQEADIDELRLTMDNVAKRATDIYGNCLKLRLLIPVMAEAFLNMVILILCKSEIRNDKARYDAFVRERIPEKLLHLSEYCVGFVRGVDIRSESYKNFLRVMNARNFAIHGNVDPVREQVEIVYFEGKRPLFADSGDHIFKLFEQLEKINSPKDLIRDYEATHFFLIEIATLLAPTYRTFFENVIYDTYPGYEVRSKRVTKILPSHNAAMLFPGERYDDDLRVEW